ncbi:hypothetical protein A2311_02565 [candidate division WOR-1 bacterium RIFOXYB2_FULL_48_7]|uniref:Putative regulatory protein FmdB zinc ribbon domain-containing protein n=1 Tax=candidate division WOR-1 bacterium RIFOXYB2_FULL_48_7 TaxID=1802583 RepID=A0A1F4TR57_UNCSA|nr:MAG: hypothetical protein A2311_02565 [candidate division WOR-1 bacterium RIFOXYB2_FULL_48_7]
MPSYDYKCGQCAARFEASHSMSGKPADLKCPKCGATELQRIFNTFARLGGGIEVAGQTAKSGCASCSSGSCSSCH